jgi:transcriptional regulator with XRE-family HTH domain
MDQDTLAHRLRLLRQRQGERLLTQPALGAILGVKAPTISSWENTDNPTVPPQERLAAYAALFASPRALREGRMPADAELTETERTQRDALLRELTDLRQRAMVHEPSPSADPWRFPDGAPVRIICGKLPEPPRTARGSRWNYMALSAFADLDAMVELFGHVRAANPASDVRVELAGRLEGKDLGAHLVLLGNLAQQQTDLRALLPQLPVRQVVDAGVEDGEVFELVADGHRFRPGFAGEEPERRVVEDIGLLARTPSPVDGTRTLTICSGTFTRGVYGAVRTLTDRVLHAANARYLQDRFAGATTWGVLMRVRGSDHAIATPRLSAPDARLFEFTA